MQFRKRGVDYRVAEHDRSAIYLSLLPLLNSNRVRLLDSKRLIAQLTGLERRAGRSGRDTIDHSPHAHDDVINAAAGALLLVMGANAGPLDHALMRINAQAPPTTESLTSAIYGAGHGRRGLDFGYGPSSGGSLDFGKAFGDR